MDFGKPTQIYWKLDIVSTKKLIKLNSSYYILQVLSKKITEILEGKKVCVSNLQ
jgi:hypothetical protein